MDQDDTITWEAPEYIQSEKTTGWYLALGIITASVSVAAILLNNFLLAILIVVGAFTLAMYSVRKPGVVEIELNKRGVIVNDHRYPYQSLESFWVDEESNEPKLIIQSEKKLMPYIILPLGEADANEIRDFLIEYIDEEEHYEPLSHKIMEYLGF